MASDKSIRAEAVRVFLPILLGGLFYIFFAPDTYFAEFAAQNFGISGVIKADTENNQILTFIRNYGMDMLWSYSLASSVMWITGDKKISLIVSSFFSAGMEFIQLSDSRLGTFDVLDIIFELCAVLIAVYFRNDVYQKQNQ